MDASMKKLTTLLYAAISLPIFLLSENALAATQLDKNLIVNGDAELAAGAEDLTTVQTPPGWAATGNFTAMKYNTTSANVVGGNITSLGSNHFFGGPNNALSSISQTIDISDRA